ncbi:hypothetical protein [Acaryochloris sp. IP29b_bin.148]|uniref:hypothetical protein n=1 Tax=Acaryochloris sp. IP29b_bin.148 TaxID=2969218 RepID=UPI00260C165A|nr:hypothetical protein [Acaryochloris sp. IP29b_bin.148]
MATTRRSNVIPVRPKKVAPSARPHPSPKHRGARPAPLLDRLDTRSPQFPNWLILLMVFRKLSAPILIMSVLGILPLYAWRVNTQQSWGNQYTQLEKLQRDQRHWITRNEERKYQISENLESNPAGFVPKSSQTTVFFEPAPARPAQPASPQRAGITAIDVAPIGY